MIILTKLNRHYKKLYVISNKYIFFFNKYRNFISTGFTYYYEYEKFKDSYIKYYYQNNKLDNITYFNYSVEIHRENGPACIDYDDNGKIINKEYYLNDKEYSYEDYLLEIKKLV